LEDCLLPGFALAFIAGHIRGIPILAINRCSFGVLGFIPLTFCYRKIEQLEQLDSNLT
jgi:hypothetical protein